MQDPLALISAYIDCSIDDEGFASLCQWLRLGQDNRVAFAKAMSDHAAIADWSSERGGGALLPELSRLDEPEIERSEWIKMLAALDSKPGQVEVVELIDLTKRRDFFDRRHMVAWGGLAAAVLVIGVVLVLSFMIGPATTPNANPIAQQDAAPKPTAPKPIQAVATLTATHNAVWSSSAPTGDSKPAGDYRRGSDLHPGDRLTLIAGFAEITTHDGAIAILEAPATIELFDNNNALRLHTGKLVGICETESSKGFLVRTPHMDITDLGTEFGVEVAGGTLTATVMTGEIELTAPNVQTRRLLLNQTARLEVVGIQREFVIEDRLAEGFTTRLPADHLVTAASINDPQFQVEVIPQGLRDKAEVHTDRTHQITGVPGGTIPEVLLGGDLIQTPADARPGTAIADLEIAIELARPADIYILFSKQGEAPDWLSLDYTLTQMRAGLDYVGPLHPAQNERTLEVWKRNQTAAPGRHVLGGPMTKKSAYFIVAVGAKDATTP